MRYLILFAAIPLETLRLFLMGRTMHNLARQKGEPPLRWIAGALLLWVGIEGGILLLSYWQFGLRYLLPSLLLAIVVARMGYHFWKKRLIQLPDPHWESQIEEIGQQDP